MITGRNNRVFFQKPSAKTIRKNSHKNGLIEEVVKPKCTLAVSRWVKNTPWVTLSLCHCCAKDQFQKNPVLGVFTKGSSEFHKVAIRDPL